MHRVRARGRLALLVLSLVACGGSPPPAAQVAPRNEAAPGSETAPSPRRAFLFSVDRAGLPTSYLHGSVHLLKDTEVGTMPEVDAAFAGADSLVVEVDVTRVDQTEIQALTLQLGVLPGGDDITRHLSPETWEKVATALPDLGLSAEGVLQMRPWLLSITVTMLSLQHEGYSPENGVDLRFLRKAHDPAAPREVLALESASQQLQMLASLPDRAQELMLEDGLARADGALLEEMLVAWRAGDAERLDEVMFGPLREQPELAPMYDVLFFERNARMSERLVQLLETRRRLFVVVGAGHLVGPRSIPELLRARGYAVEQVASAPAGGASAARATPVP